jgi:hypothetical protein
VETLSPGAFPLVITVTSPNGQLLVSRSQLTIRSTVVSGVGALVTVGAGAFLLAWWGNDLRRARRRTRELGSRQAKRHRLARRRLRPPRPGLPVDAKLPRSRLFARRPIAVRLGAPAPVAGRRKRLPRSWLFAWRLIAVRLGAPAPVAGRRKRLP